MAPNTISWGGWRQVNIPILKNAAKLGALARGVFEAFDTLSFLIEAQNMVQVPVLTGVYAF
jgi:hypothetical protein